MLPTQFLKRYFPNAPDWLLGGVLLVFALWLIVLPVEIIEIVVRQEYIPGNVIGWFVRFLYIWGYAISLFLISPFADYSTVSGQLVELIIVQFGLIVTSPVYFAIGALITIRKDITITLGFLVLAINLVLSCVVTVWLMKFLFAG